MDYKEIKKKTNLQSVTLMVYIKQFRTTPENNIT